MKHIWYTGSPFGPIGIAEDGRGIFSLFFLRGEKPGSMEETRTPLLGRAEEELAEYFSGIRREFDLPLSLEGTEFQRADWAALLEIPYGETRTYGQIAVRLGNPKACRAVGMANHRNPIAILVPCHRVVGKNGSLTGYAGGLNIKAGLLGLEKHHCGV